MVNRLLYVCCIVVERHLPGCVLCLVSSIVCGIVFVDGGFESSYGEQWKVPTNGNEIGFNVAVAPGDVVPVVMQGNAQTTSNDVVFIASGSGHSPEMANDEANDERDEAPVCHRGFILLFWLCAGVLVGSMR